MIHHQNLNQPQSFGDFAHGHYTAVVHQVNLPFSYYHRSKGTSLPTGDEEPYDMRETLFVRSPDRMEEAQVVPFHLLLHHHPHLHRRNRKERQAYSLLQTTMEPLPHGHWSCSSKPLTGRTGCAEGRFSYWNYWRYNLNRTLPPRTRTHRTTTMTCLVGHPSIEGYSCSCRNDDLPRLVTNTSQETDFASQLVFASHTGHQDYQPPTLTTDTNKWEQLLQLLHR